MTSSWGVENVLTSLGLPGSWEGTEQFLVLLNLNHEEVSIYYHMMVD